METPAHGLIFNNIIWMGWNAGLALIPFSLSMILFQPKQKITLFWVLGFLAFFFFLPNAPYIFTDIVHLYTASAHMPSHASVVSLVFQYMVFLLLGAWLFCYSYTEFENFTVKKLRINRFSLRVATFILLSIGVYLGRFARLNSWNIVNRPIRVIESLANLRSLHALLYVLFFTALLFLVYVFYKKFDIHPKRSKK